VAQPHVATANSKRVGAPRHPVCQHAAHGTHVSYELSSKGTGTVNGRPDDRIASVLKALACRAASSRACRVASERRSRNCSSPAMGGAAGGRGGGGLLGRGAKVHGWSSASAEAWRARSRRASRAARDRSRRVESVACGEGG
jgi:hypothetical protein